MQVKVIAAQHTCSTTSFVGNKMASYKWCAGHIKDWLIEDPSLGPKELKMRLQEKFHIDVSYFKVWTAKEAALEEIQGSWDDSFDMLYSFKAEVEKKCPGSMVDIEYTLVKGRHLFSRVFVALKPCIDGFLYGCRPYLGVDSTHLTGKYKGQLASATAVDGHNWMFPVCWAIFDSETLQNWEWFMERVKIAIGTPSGLAIHTDACKGLETAINNVFTDGVEHRECMLHLWRNLKKKFKGPVIDNNMWPAARTCNQTVFQGHMSLIASSCPELMQWLHTYHPHKWSKSMFNGMCKVDYINNNISESFNSKINAYKGLPIVELLDRIRQFVVAKMELRGRIASKLEGKILPHILQQLNANSRGLKGYRITRCGPTGAEVSSVESATNDTRYAVELDERMCSCNQWQISGKPCNHAVAFICHTRGKLEDFVDDYFGVDKFKAAYAGVFRPIPDKSQWESIDPGFKLYPPNLKRPAGRPKTQRYKDRLKQPFRTDRPFLPLSKHC